MKIQVRYFASLKEQLGPEQWLDTRTWAEPAPATVGQLRDWLVQQSQVHAQALDVGAGAHLRAALNQAVCDMDTPLLADPSGACEVAFFPPVTGG